MSCLMDSAVFKAKDQDVSVDIEFDSPLLQAQCCIHIPAYKTCDELLMIIQNWLKKSVTIVIYVFDDLLCEKVL